MAISVFRQFVDICCSCRSEMVFEHFKGGSVEHVRDLGILGKTSRRKTSKKGPTNGMKIVLSTFTVEKKRYRTYIPM